MNICIYNFYSTYNYANRLFSPAVYTIGADLCRPFIELKNLLEKYGHSVFTIDQLSLDSFDLFVFLDFPDNNIGLLDLLKQKNKKMVLWCLESEIVHPSNNQKKYYSFFDYILNYNKKQLEDIENSKQILIPQPMYEDINLKKLDFKQKKLCVVISGNKNSFHKNELYSERLANIIWFSKKHNKDFDLYGFGWKDKIVRDMFITIKGHRLKVFSEKYNNNCYKGLTKDKIETLSRYKFSICFENVKNINSYITEKIFDCFYAHCVPIYYGADNIKEYIPENCFIDYREFKNKKLMFDYINNMTEEKYNNYIKNIDDFLVSDGFKKFNIYSVADCLLKI